MDGVRFLGSAVATQLSVAVTTMFGDRHLDAAEKKALVFTDSVQDAAHRAGFVQSRAHVFNFRNAARSAVRGTMSLHEVAEAMLADATTPERRFRLMPPDLVDRAGFRPFWDPASGQQPSVAVRNRVRARVQFDLALEFGLQSRVGRTLELTGSVAASVDAGPASALEAIGRAAIEGFEVAGRLDEGGDPVAGPALVSWVRGTLERMRERGSIAHPWLRPYLDHNGERWYVWGGRPRNQGMPAFPKDREAPAFPRVGAHAAGGRPSLLDHATSSQGWYARWATRFFDVPAADGARLARRLFEQLAKAGVIVPHPIAGSEAVAYTIEPDRILLAAIADDDLAAGRTSLVCDTCESPVPGSIDTVDQLTDGPCMVANCKGRLRRRGGEPGNYYRQQYDEGEMRRVVAREHTSLLDDATRLSYETAFKSAADRPDAPNVLVATPTLEMGIDIGDLSTVFLAGLPRTVASYVQRVGRAGRLTGNALAMAFVLGRGDQLPKLGDPLATIEGAVRPPATYLNAVEILRRQYVAFLIDTMSAEGRSGQVAQARDVLRRTEGTSVLATLIREGEEHAEERLATFLGTFDELATAAADSLRAWATPQAEQRGTSGLALAAIDAAARWNRDVETLRLRRSAIEDSLDALKSAAEAPTATSDDGVAYRAARASAAMVRRQLETLRGEHWVAALERFGLLPNYTLLDDHAQLDVAVSWIDPDSQEYVAEDRSYERGRSIAIQELAPGATFYAQGLEIAIDAVDLGRDGAALRRMTFCPSCGFAADAGPAPIPACPRCGEKAIADTNQTMPVVELEQVSAEVRRDESSISDRVDERTRTRFLVQLAPDFDPARLVDARFVAETGFGFRAYTDLELRWVNLGRVGGGAPRAIAGSGDVLAPLFRVCSGCGKLDSHGNANSPREHRAWCRYRAAREEHVETIALTRTLRTQGLLLRLPTWLTIGSTLTRLSFAAGLQLGLGALIGGDPDHLRFAFVAEPAPDDEANPTGLLIHDAVPGGTGYLADLADLGRLRRVLELAHERLADCACAAEGRSACDRCLLPYAPNGSADAVSRVSALQSIERLLRLDEGGAWTESREDPGPLDPESHLEQWFRAVFRERVEALGAAVQEEPGEWGERLVITLPGQGRRWTLRPQVLAGPARPDFVLEASGSPVAPVAIFTDGFAYHASVAHNRLADDAEKRRALRELGYRVVAVTWRDLQDAKAGAAAGADGWYDAATAETWVDPFGLSPAALDLVTEDPLALLVRHLQDPLTTEERWERVADALPFLTFTRSVADAAGGALAGRAAALAAGSAAPGGDGGWALVRPHLAMVTRRAATGGTHTETALVLDDRPEAVSQPDFADAWRLWLRLSVLLGARSERRAVMATVEGVGATASEPVPATIVGPIDLALSEDWSAVLDVAYGEERDLLLALSAVPGMVVPDVGLEVGDGIPVGVAWLDRRIAVDLGLEDRDRQDLERGGGGSSALRRRRRSPH
ncbi:helicase-related protein [Amnibacterium kyonggiense]